MNDPTDTVAAWFRPAWATDTSDLDGDTHHTRVATVAASGSCGLACGGSDVDLTPRLSATEVVVVDGATVRVERNEPLVRIPGAELMLDLGEAEALRDGLDELLDAVNESGSVRLADGTPAEDGAPTAPRDGETCSCGRPAVVVYETAAHGRVGDCGLRDGGVS